CRTHLRHHPLPTRRSSDLAAHLVHVLLDELGLPAFLKTSGGKGLHVVVPIQRRYEWDDVKGFSHAVVQHLAHTIPQRFVARSGPDRKSTRLNSSHVKISYA